MIQTTTRCRKCRSPMKKDGDEYVCTKCGTKYDSIRVGPYEKSVPKPKIPKEEMKLGP